MSDLHDVFEYIDAHHDHYVADLQRLVRQPSVSAQGIGIAETAAIVEQMLADCGFDVAQYSTSGNPIVFGERAGVSSRRLTFYNHYDVQPADPLELWNTDPWSADIRDGRIWGRGVADNKGNLVARLSAIDALLKVRGELPLTVKYIVEGEEEIGSIHIEEFTHAHGEKLASDGCIWESGGRDDQGRLDISLGMKGICYLELSVQTVSEDQHSSKAIRLPNAAWRLTWALASLKGPDERIKVKGFYDKVRQPTPAELAVLAEIPDNSASEMARLGIDHYLLGLTGAERIQRDYFEPTCTISGILSGYTGEGSKTVMPARAMAKVDHRLVPDQDPDEIEQLIRIHLDEHGFSDVSIKAFGNEKPGRSSLDSTLVRVVDETWREMTGKETTIAPTSLGTGPWYYLNDALGIDGCTAGAGHPASSVHAPNENIYVEDYIRHIKHAAMIMDRFATAV
jgi:acetylornithine deacetylase/succinyl-diaminopimelate desuccinylase-like protein